MGRGLRKLTRASAPLVAAVTAGITVLAGPTAAGSAVAAQPGAAPQSVALGSAAGTPALAPNGNVERVRQIALCGGKIFAVGSFTKISWHGKIFSRQNAFSFRATAPYTMSSWNPGISGQVNSVAFQPGNCHSAFLGGSFDKVHGTIAHNIVKVSTSTGAVLPSFRHSASKAVDTLLVHGGHVLAGGYFTSINGSNRHFYASLNPSTGRDDGYLRLRVSGQYSYAGAIANSTRIYNQQLSHAGDRLLVEGDFTSVGGQHRQQIFMLSLGTSRGTVTGWTSDEFNQFCVGSIPFYIHAASWAVGDNTVYIAATGYHPLGGPTGATPRTGLCDSASAFPAANEPVQSTWINYTGCDSLYSTAADRSTAYFGGHERWASNPDDCDAPGPGAISAPGIVGLSPDAGQVIFNPTRGRGHSADDMLVTSAGLWVASDNQFDTTMCGGKAGHAGICFFGYPRRTGQDFGTAAAGGLAGSGPSRGAR